VSIRLLPLQLRDHARYNRWVRWSGGVLLGCRAEWSAKRRHALLCRAYDLCEGGALGRLFQRRLMRLPDTDEAEVWGRAVDESRIGRLARESPLLSRSIVLKAPGAGGEKGVLLLTFEYNWVRLFKGLGQEGMRWLDERFVLVLSTSWSPTDYAALMLGLSMTRDTLFVQACNHQEMPLIEGFHPRLKCLESLPCDWINPEHYSVQRAERETDIVMVANWGEFKRHWDLFRALAKMPAALKVVLIGQKEGGRTGDDILQLARQMGARQEITVLESVPIEEVARQQAMAKVSVIMSRREGCCVAAVESLFADCALAMRDDAHVGPLAYINEQTGSRLRPGKIAEDLMALLQRADGMRPRDWAIKNISGVQSWARLNAVLQRHAKEKQSPWNAGVVLPQWRPHPTFARAEDSEAMAPTYDDLHQRFPGVFPADLRTESWR
jgi:glycosyltransferase involved in cell wall biosynthesis